jgi:hypothetical protein
MTLTPTILLPKQARRSGRGPRNAFVPVAESPCAPDMPMLPFHTLDFVHKGDRHARAPGAATERSTQPPGQYNTDYGRDRAYGV